MINMIKINFNCSHCWFSSLIWRRSSSGKNGGGDRHHKEEEWRRVFPKAWTSECSDSGHSDIRVPVKKKSLTGMWMPEHQRLWVRTLDGFWMVFWSILDDYWGYLSQTLRVSLRVRSFWGEINWEAPSRVLERGRGEK